VFSVKLTVGLLAGGDVGAGESGMSGCSIRFWFQWFDI